MLGAVGIRMVDVLSEGGTSTSITGARTARHVGRLLRMVPNLFGVFQHNAVLAGLPSRGQKSAEVGLTLNTTADLTSNCSATMTNKNQGRETSSDM